MCWALPTNMLPMRMCGYRSSASKQQAPVEHLQVYRMCAQDPHTAKDTSVQRRGVLEATCQVNGVLIIQIGVSCLFGALDS